MKKLFELSSCYDEGYDGADDLFSANSREEVAEYMLKEIRKYLENKDENRNENSKGAKYFRILRMMKAEIINSKKGYEKIRKNGFVYDDYEMEIFEKRMRKITPAQLLGAMDSSYVDGDSNAQICLHEYRFEDIIEV